LELTLKLRNSVFQLAVLGGKRFILGKDFLDVDLEREISGHWEDDDQSGGFCEQVDCEN
jgi:hypothetical protein